jgi:hypothetical protein
MRPSSSGQNSSNIDHYTANNSKGPKIQPAADNNVSQQKLLVQK